MKYALNAFHEWLEGNITTRTLVYALCHRPVAVCGRLGNIVLDNIEYQHMHEDTPVNTGTSSQQPNPTE